MGGEEKTLNEHVARYVLSGTSCVCAAIVTNPIDVIKVRMQLDNELRESGKVVSVLRERYYRGFVRGSVTIAKDEGIRGLYKGVFPSILREASYSTIRLGSYEPMKELLGATDPAHTPLWKKIIAGATSGAIGSSIATPTDLVKVRLQAEKRLPPGVQPRYRSTFHAFSEIWHTEGLRGLYRGIGPTVKRAAILTASQIPSYDHTKHAILNAGLMEEGFPLFCVSAMVAGFITAFVTSPVDVIKTRIMNQASKHLPRDQWLYRNSLDCLLKTMRSEGLFGLYKGFIPNWMRIGPHTIVTFLIFEELRRLIGMKAL
ncbi:PREDICTED: mitochondrial substrate carrier family protein ucpB-like [Branchiostoma belcheri]|uniref:Mitochondrial substrate carrier family protein ucpB-like n=1 Tax=Branchiostoma belcheri TaxID=7741 RepID=A0A6P4YSB8_BRABE|nr:PREDICTED: mitochondrial substrate carrier family protein ucpB-like [Branchiostoma belcheri]